MKSDSSVQMMQAKQEMQSELDRLRATAGVLEESSRTIGSIKGTYDKYTSSLSKASKTLRQLQRRMESDDRMIYYSFLFFVFSAGYVFLKRIRVISLMRWLGMTGWSGAEWVYDSTSGSGEVVYPTTALPESDYPLTSTTYTPLGPDLVYEILQTTTNSPTAVTTAVTTSHSEDL